MDSQANLDKRLGLKSLVDNSLETDMVLVLVDLGSNHMAQNMDASYTPLLRDI
jgi:hypothetical protein